MLANGKNNRTQGVLLLWVLELTGGADSCQIPISRFA